MVEIVIEKSFKVAQIDYMLIIIYNLVRCQSEVERDMIITVTMNPAIDKTVEIPKFIYNGLNRIQRVEYDAGGKGINVSKTICELGGESIATGFIAGNGGRTILNVLHGRGIRCDFVEVEGETRTNTKVIEPDGTLTELNEPGPQITETDMQRLKEKLLGFASPENVFVFAGSIPAGVPKNIYGELITLVKKQGAKVLLDADGEAFREAVEAGPDYIKPNQVELAEYCGLGEDAGCASLIEAAGKLQNKGVGNIVISMGKQGAMFLLDGYKAKCPGLKVKAHSAVGAGDAMVAALSYAQDKGLSKEETVRLCMAVSAGAVTTIGTKPPSRDVVEELIQKVTIQEIGE